VARRVEWSDVINEDFLRWQRSIGMGRPFMDYLLLPVRVILQGGHDYRHFGASISKSWIFFVPLAAISAPVVPAVRRCLLPDPTRAAALYTSPDGALTLYELKVPGRG
jgi:hypothetical protein